MKPIFIKSEGKRKYDVLELLNKNLFDVVIDVLLILKDE